MRSTALKRTFAAAVIATAACGLVAGCGDDSTATSTPTVELTTTKPPQSSSSDSPDGSSAVTSPSAAATAPPEKPQPVPSGFPGPTGTAAPTAADKAFLEALEKGGITPTPENARSIGGYICNAIKQGSSPEEITTFVTAFVGTTPESTKLEPGDAAKVYIDAAKSTYCK
jgi:hypothetical protein